MPEPDCFLRYRICAGTPNSTLGKSDVYVLAAAATRGYTMLLFTEPVSRRNTFVGGTCAPPSAITSVLQNVTPPVDCVTLLSVISATWDTFLNSDTVQS